MNSIIEDNRNELKMYAEKLVSYESNIKDHTYKNQEL